jgi:FimV-like protein
MDIDPLQIKLDMASLCIEMGDIESAQAILEEIIGEADKQGKAKAREILDSIET